ncbi:hypothetical protein Tco_0866709 [Tanacetum coccineum]
MYLTTSRPDIMFAVCACARDSEFNMEAFFDSDYAGASLDKKSTTGELLMLLIACGLVLCIKLNAWDYGVLFSHVAVSGAKKPRVGAPAQTRSERVLKQPNEPPLPEGNTSESGEGRMEHTFKLMDIVLPTPHGSPLPGVYTPGSDEGRLKLEELMSMCIKLSKQVLDLEKKKDAQAVEILKLKKRVKKLERQRKSSISYPRRRIYRQVESSDDDLDEEDASK